MQKGTIFISHREEYASVVQELKRIISNFSNGKVQAFISDEIPHANDWRRVLEERLRDCEHLFLIYGAPYEDWSWCFYEVGYFGGQLGAGDMGRKTFCIMREGVDPPGPLAHLQTISTADALKAALSGIFEANGAACDEGRLATALGKLSDSLFSPVEEFEGFPRLVLAGKDADFTNARVVPDGARLEGDRWTLHQLFGINKSSVTWKEIVNILSTVEGKNDRTFLLKWLDETSQIVLQARTGKFVTPQTILLARTGARRCRFLLSQARVRADGVYCCEFLVLTDVGGPTVELSTELLALLTGIRMGFRFRYEVVEANQNLQLRALPLEDRVEAARQIHRKLSNMRSEAQDRGNFTPTDFLSNFEETERARMATILGYWPVLERDLYSSMGMSTNGEIVPGGLEGDNIPRFQETLKGLYLLNTEFLGLSCERLSRRMGLSTNQIQQNREVLDMLVATLAAIPPPSPPAVSEQLSA